MLASKASQECACRISELSIFGSYIRRSGCGSADPAGLVFQAHYDFARFTKTLRAAKEASLTITLNVGELVGLTL